MPVIIRSSGGFGGGSSKGYPTDSVNIIRASAYNKSVILQWSDPQDTVLDAIVFARWAGTLVVKKEGEAPLNEKDGEIILDNKIRDKYKDAQFVDENVEYEKTYYYRFFPYSDKGVYSTDLKNVTTGITPKEVQPIFGDNTFDQIHYAIQQGMHDTLWNIGDTIKVYFNEITDLTVTDQNGRYPKTFSTPPGYVEFMIADFNKNTRYKDETIIKQAGIENGHTLWYTPYDYEENPQNIILVQKTACVSGEPTYFSSIGIDLSDWCFPGEQTYLDEFTRKCHLHLSDVPAEKVDEYFCDIDFRCYYPWDTSLQLGGHTSYFCRQKFFRVWYECLNLYQISDRNIGRLRVFSDDSSRIYKDKNGNKKNYMLLESAWSIDDTDSHINTGGVFSNGFKSNESGRIFCALK